MRKAREQWPVRLNRVVTTDPAALERFYELESSGWKGKGKTAIACSPAIRRFYDAIAKAGAQAGYFSLYLLEFGDTRGGRSFRVGLQRTLLLAQGRLRRKVCSIRTGALDCGRHPARHRGPRFRGIRLSRPADGVENGMG